ncbi:Aurora kinase A-A [Orchesella cincta]|uniref:Aurora kinase n=1 Tax=Orchesella cincta TaxID=48709 RepID=A0A1D2N486_ORCCI|nr:Aurora kinase A-A [Orchesella cincta]
MFGNSNNKLKNMGPGNGTPNKMGQNIAEQDLSRIDKTQWYDPRKVPKPPNKPWQDWRLGKDFEIGKPLGEGKFGHVYLARTAREKRYVALKVIHSKQIEEDRMEHQINRETDIHIDLDHPNIIKMFGYFRDGDKIVYVLEYAPGGEVYAELLRQPGSRYSDQKAATYICQLTHALDYLHQKKIMHRDIKPENLLIGFRGEIKMADFGWSIKTAGHSNHRRKTMCGTLDYLPPEMVNQKTYDEKVDLWCLGVLTYEFLVGKPPFETNHRDDTYRKITSGQIEFPGYVQPDARNFIEKILHLDPSQRMNLREARSHQWITKNRIPEIKDRYLPMFEKLKPLLPVLKQRYEEAAEVSRAAYNQK